MAITNWPGGSQYLNFPAIGFCRTKTAVAEDEIPARVRAV